MSMHEQCVIATRLTKEKLLREPDKPRGISHSDSLCIARGANVALFNSVRSALPLTGRSSASRGTPERIPGCSPSRENTT